jgi:hypothetical protein
MYMNIIFESYFSAVQLSADKNCLHIEAKDNAALYSESDFLYEIALILQTIDSNTPQAPLKVLINMQFMKYRLSTSELEEIISLQQRAVQKRAPEKIAIVYPMNKEIAIFAEILIQTYILEELNVKGFLNIENAKNWLLK